MNSLWAKLNPRVEETKAYYLHMCLEGRMLKVLRPISCSISCGEPTQALRQLTIVI